MNNESSIFSTTSTIISIALLMYGILCIWITALSFFIPEISVIIFIPEISASFFPSNIYGKNLENLFSSLMIFLFGFVFFFIAETKFNGIFSVLKK